MNTTTLRDPEFELLLEFLKASRGFDFTGYKRSTLMRRVHKRMQAVEVASFEAYRDYLELNPGEYSALFNTILINVTSFFRDPEAWQVMADEFIPALLERKGPDRPIRVWSAGCATGQETYTLVMLLAEALGPDAFRERVKVYATDWDEEALAHARAAVYRADDLEALPDGFRERYFEPSGGGWTFRGDLRRQVIFGRHDLVQDAPISHLDVLTCRNVLMYFNTEVQHRILARFHFALAPDGVLLLGKAEMMRSHASLFIPANLPARVFSKSPGPLRDRLILMNRPPERTPSPAPAAQQTPLLEAAVNTAPGAQIAVSTAGILLLANHAARRQFALASADVGRPLQDLTLSYRPVELRSRIEQVLAERRALYLSSVEHRGDDGELRAYDVQVCPLEAGADGLLGVSVSFTDVTRYVRLQAEVEEAHQALETAFEELQSTNEEMETTNEELQSTIEELETTNEELQSTNEELETMNEELQSTNEELETLNDELQRRTMALNDANAYLSSVLANLRAAVVVVDRDMLVQVWNRKMEEMWGLRSDEVSGQPLLHLDVGLPVEQLKTPVRAVLEGRAGFQELALDAVNRRGRTIGCRVTVAPLVGAAHDVRGSVILIEEQPEAVRLAPGANVTG